MDGKIRPPFFGRIYAYTCNNNNPAAKDITMASYGKLTILSALMMVMSGSAWACSCGGNETAQAILNSHSAVFTAVVHRVDPRPNGRSLTVFGIVEAFKGPPAGAQLRVLHPSRSSASCGVQFRPGYTYTLAAQQGSDGQGYSTSLCSVWMFGPNSRSRGKLLRDMRAMKRRY